MNNKPVNISELTAEEKRALLAELLRAQVQEPVLTYPMSYGQRALWFLYRLAPESPAYNIMYLGRIRSQLDIPALGRAVRALADRHAILRTTYGYEDEPVQQLHDCHEIRLEVIETSTWSEPELQQRLKEEADRPFDLARGPVLRLQLFRQSTEEHLLLLTAHHIALDFSCFDILLDELDRLYRAERSGSPMPLPALELAYTDFGQWQTEMLAGPEGQRLWAYWQQQLAGELPALNLPTDRPRPPSQSYCGAVHHFDLGQPLTRKLRSLSNAQRTTLYTTILAAWYVLLYRYSGQEEILIGSPMIGRSRPELEKIVGYFANPIVLRAYLAGNPPFTEFLRQVSRTVVDGLAHQDYPFSLLVEQLQSPREPSRSPLFQVALDWVKLPPGSTRPGPRSRPELSLTGRGGAAIPLETVTVGQRGAPFDLMLTISELYDSLSGKMRYNTDLFEAPTINRLTAHFVTLLESIVATPEKRLANLSLMTVAERDLLLREWNATGADYPRKVCLHHLFENQVKHLASRDAVVFENRRLTYEELNRRADCLAGYLQDLGVEPETLVGICMERSIEMIVALLGVLKAGGAYLPLDPAYPPDRLGFMLADSQAAVLLTHRTLIEAIPGQTDLQVVYLDSDWDRPARNGWRNLHQQVQPDNLAYVIYTSGSTGQPKGVQIEHKSVVNFLAMMRQEPGLTDQDVWLAVTTLSFDISALEIFLPLTTGARLALASRATVTDGQRLAAILASSGATVMQATPTTWRMLVESGWTGQGGLKILCGGEALPVGLASQLLQRGASLWNLYGPTETTIWSTVYRVQPGDTTVPIGRPIGNTRCYILDPYLEPVPIGAPGELYLGGDGLARGYLNRPDLTDARFIPNPFDNGGSREARLYKTGDRVRYRPDGTIEFLGRTDSQLKLHGFRVEPGEIETVLTQHPAVREALIMVREDKPGDKRLVGYLTLRQPDPPTPSELRHFLGGKLPRWMIPGAFVFLAAWPLTSNQKIDRRALPAPEVVRPGLDQRFVAPRTETEKKLANICAHILRVDRVGVHDNFFDLGGASIQGLEFVARAREAGFNLTLELLFQHQTIAGLVSALGVASPVSQTALKPEKKRRYDKSSREYRQS